MANAKTLILRLVFAAVTAMALFAIASRTAQERPFTISAAILGGVESVDYQALEAFKRSVESGSGGAIQVNIYPYGQFCGNEKECIDALKSGALDIFFTTASAVGIIYDGGQVLDLPYAFGSEAIAQCVLAGPFQTRLRDAILDDGQGLRLVAATGVGGWRHFATTRRAVRSPSDLKGLKIRTTPSAIQQEFVRALGATPTPVAWSELYTAFGAGVIDGAKNTINDVMISNNNEHIRFITLDGHVYMSGLWWYSERTWRRTPAAYVPVIEQGIEALRQTTIDLPPKISQGYADAFVADGGELIALSETELAAFKAAARRVRAWYQERQGDRWLDALDEAVADCERVAG